MSFTQYAIYHSISSPQTNSFLETRQKPQRIPQRGLNAPSPSRPPRTLSRQDHPQGGRNVLHRNGRLQNLLRTRRKARLHPPGRPETRLRPQTRHRVLPPQADLPSHRTSLRAYPGHRLRSSGRMLRSRHEEVPDQHQLEPGGSERGNHAPGEPNPRCDSLCERRASYAALSSLPRAFYLRGSRTLRQHGHAYRTRLSKRNMQDPIHRPFHRRAARKPNPAPDSHILRGLSRLRRAHLREPNSPDVRIWTPLSWAPWPGRRMYGTHAVRV